MSAGDSSGKNRGIAYGMWLVLAYLAMVPMAIYFLIGNLT